jgi:hypothetical protein
LHVHTCAPHACHSEFDCDVDVLKRAASLASFEFVLHFRDEETRHVRTSLKCVAEAAQEYVSHSLLNLR